MILLSVLRFAYSFTVSVKSNRDPRAAVRFWWQGQKESNPQPTVLETVALPAELFPYTSAWLLYDISRPLSSQMLIKRPGVTRGVSLFTQLCSLLGGLEGVRAVVADGADEVGRESLALVEVAADGAQPALLLVDDGGDVVLEVLGAVLAQRADEVRGQLRALVEVAADLADPALDGRRRGGLLGLDVGVVVAVGAARLVREHVGLDDLGDVEHLRAAVARVDDAGGEHRVGVLADVAHTVHRAQVVRPVGELVHVAARLEAEVLEDVVGRVLGEDADVEDARLGDHVAGVVGLDAAYRDLLRVGAGDLAGGVDDAAVVLAVHAGGEDLAAVAELVEGRVLDLIDAVHAALGADLDLHRRGLRGQDVGGDGVGQDVELGELALGEGALDGQGVADELGALELGEQLAHEPAAGGGP